MKRNDTRLKLAAAVTLLLGAAAAQAADNDWQFRASIYGYIPNIGGETNFPAGGSEIDIAAEDLIDNAKFVGMASFEAQRGRWGAFVDFIYMDIGDSVSGATSLGAGAVPLPPDLTADASLDIEATVTTLAANYRALETSQSSFDLFAGARLLDATGELGWKFNVDLSPLGAQLFSSFGNQYPGDPAFDELFQELERRKAIVHIHPSTIVPGATVPRLSIPWGIVEFVLDTSRCITNLLLSGTFERYPSIRYIVSHAGGTIPYIAWRIAMSAHEFPEVGEKAPKGALHYLKKLYYDTALSTSEQVFAALKEFVPMNQVLFGSDWPMVPEGAVKMETHDLEASKVLDDATRTAIYRENSLALFPRFASKAAKAA